MSPYIDLEKETGANLSDSVRINSAVAKLHEEHGGGVVRLSPRTYMIDQPIVMRSGVALDGAGDLATQLRAGCGLEGPIIETENWRELIDKYAWLHSEGVPVRFSISNLLVNGEDAELGPAQGSGTAVLLYGKAFRVSHVQIINAKRIGLHSIGSAKGGQESWLDEPEAVFDVRISRCGTDGFLMQGPHDAIIRSAIIALCKGRGLRVEANQDYNGACDIEFCHAYATDKIAIDIQGKVKAGFLQGDTGRSGGVRLSGTDKTYVDRVECFKTRGTIDDFALQVEGSYTQIGLARVRSDWGASGVRLNSLGAQIGQLDIDGRRNTGGPLMDSVNNGIGLLIEKPQVTIQSFNIRHFSEGAGLKILEGIGGVYARGITKDCSVHVEALGKSPIDLNVRMVRRKNESVRVDAGSARKIALQDV